jgi:hypothetical protein
MNKLLLDLSSVTTVAVDLAKCPSSEHLALMAA